MNTPLPERHIPFKFSECSIPQLPEIVADTFIAELQRIPEAERLAMIRIWVQDRRPIAFSSAPYLWEAVREWIARRYDLAPRQIGLAGSAQIGFSTHPKKAFSPFNVNGSDLDLYIVSELIYEETQREASQFVSRQFSAEKSDFLDQASITEKTLRKGYVDLHHIPANHQNYPKCARLKNDASIIIDKLKLSGFNLKPSHFRIYQSWKIMENWTRLQANSWASRYTKIEQSAS